MARQLENLSPVVIQKMQVLFRNCERLRKKNGETQEEFSVRNLFGGRQNYASYKRKNECPTTCVLMIEKNYKLKRGCLFEKEVIESEVSQETPEILKIRISDLDDKIQFLNQINAMKDQVIDMKTVMVQDKEVALQSEKNHNADLEAQIIMLKSEKEMLENKLAKLQAKN